MESIPKRVNTFIWIIFLAIIGIGVYYLENRISSTPQEKAESTLIPSIKTESRDSSTQNVTSFQRTVTESDIELIRAKVPKFYKIIVFSPKRKTVTNVLNMQIVWLLKCKIWDMRLFQQHTSLMQSQLQR